MNMYSHKGTATLREGGAVEAVDAAKILSDPTRLRVLQILFENPEGMCVYEIAEEVGSSPSATSHQLAKLEGHGIVRCYREGQKMCYQLTRAPLVTRIRKVLNLFKIV